MCANRTSIFIHSFSQKRAAACPPGCESVISFDFNALRWFQAIFGATTTTSFLFISTIKSTA
jgi:hypothetical protein